MLAQPTALCCLVTPSLNSPTCLCAPSAFRVTRVPLLPRRSLLLVAFVMIPPAGVGWLHWGTDGPFGRVGALEEPRAAHRIPLLFRPKNKDAETSTSRGGARRIHLSQIRWQSSPSSGFLRRASAGFTGALTALPVTAERWRSHALLIVFPLFFAPKIRTRKSSSEEEARVYPLDVHAGSTFIRLGGSCHTYKKKTWNAFEF